MIQSIALPTDFSSAGSLAFVHALRLAVQFRAQLTLLHVRDPGDSSQWAKFPHVRETLERWGMLEQGSEISEVERKLGVLVRKVDIRDRDAVDGLSRFFAEHRPDLVVMATHGRVGLNRWLSGSVATELTMLSAIPALLFGPDAQHFVDPLSGDLALERVAVPVDHDPPAGPAVARIEDLLGQLGVTRDLFHIGADTPLISGWTGELRMLEGDPVETILAEGANAGLLAMPTAGRHGFLDAIRGSTTERVVHEAKCPVLAVPG